MPPAPYLPHMTVFEVHRYGMWNLGMRHCAFAVFSSPSGHVPAGESAGVRASRATTRGQRATSVPATPPPPTLSFPVS